MSGYKYKYDDTDDEDWLKEQQDLKIFGHSKGCPGCPSVPSERGGYTRLCQEDMGWLIRIYLEIEQAAKTGIWDPPGHLKIPMEKK